MYITYDEYISMGGALSESDFRRAAVRATAELDSQTFGRLRGDESVSTTVKACLVELVDVCAAGFAQYGDAQAAPIASTSNDGVSVTYAAPSMADWFAKVYPQRVRGILQLYLADERNSFGVPLLYRGCGM